MYVYIIMYSMTVARFPPQIEPNPFKPFRDATYLPPDFPVLVLKYEKTCCCN